MTAVALTTKNATYLLKLVSEDGTNRLTRACVRELARVIKELAQSPRPLVITGNQKFFSAGADLNEIQALTGPEALAFSTMGQEMTSALDRFPAPVIAAINGYCMGGGLDIILACDLRIAAPHAIFGHRGAALGLITGWGGTQRLVRLIGQGHTLQMFTAAEKIHVADALRFGLVDVVAEDPVAAALLRAQGAVAQH
jgi:enoyl-CoA hydratase/carnithine racemase